MVPVRSVRTVTFTEAGRLAFNCGRSFSMRSTTPMMFAPGWRWIFTITAGVIFIHAACFVFSAPSTTLATSDMRTGAPLRYAMMTGLYSALVSS